jgi:hypothetical protein
MKINFSKTLKFLSSKWNIILATVSVLGMLTFNFIPNINDTYFKLFVFLGINALLWTIVEIKIKIDENKPNETERYSDMRQARPFIMNHIYKTMKTNKESILNIEIVGGRIRTISDMLRELKHEIVNHKLHARNIHIRVLTLHPDFIKNWNFTKSNPNPHFIQRNEGNASLIRHLKEELIAYNEVKEFKDSNIKIEVEYYETFPFFYSHIIGNKYIYYGFFTWNSLDEDFVGPENPCYFLDTKNESFQDYYNIVSNRVQFLRHYKQ